MSHWFDQLAKRAAGATPAQPPAQAGVRASTPEITMAASAAPGGHAYTRRRGLQLAMFALLGTTFGPRTLLWPSPARADALGACGDAYQTCEYHRSDDRSNSIQACYFSNLHTGDIYDIIAINQCTDMAQISWLTGLGACITQYDNCYDAAEGGSNGGTPPPPPPPDTGCPPGTADCAPCCGYDTECECVCLGGVWCGSYCVFSGQCPQ